VPSDPFRRGCQELERQTKAEIKCRCDCRVGKILPDGRFDGWKKELQGGGKALPEKCSPR
jgi:hypothetical protein